VALLKILVLNSGSSSQKIHLYELADQLPSEPPEPWWAATLEWNRDWAEVSVHKSGGRAVHARAKVDNRRAAIEYLLGTLWSGTSPLIEKPSLIDVVGHRVVHGGPHYRQPARIDSAVKAAIAGVSAFAPLHNRAELDGVEIIEKVFGPVPQIAVFDTGFHSRMPLHATVYPGPYEWFEEGIRRYGFHGINHEYCARRTAQLMEKELDSLRLVTCHLGNGCSLAAVRDGHSIDTTMGFTPLEGLMMGTRSGSIDPGILTYLMRQTRVTGEQLDEILNKKSGLRGISGVSSDMRQILSEAKRGEPLAALAFEMFVHRLLAGIGSMTAVLGGIDALVFTAGIGEHSPEVRKAVCANLHFLGIQLDSNRNANPAPDQDISCPEARTRVFVIRAQEDWAIARECRKMIENSMM
jgi:acetate kinase